jgi:hypothetical protein
LRSLCGTPLTLRASGGEWAKMVLVADDLLQLPAKFFEIILSTLVQTAYKTRWAEYRGQLTVLLLRLKRDYAEGKISRDEMKEMESRIFRELRIAKKVLGTSVD